MEQSVAVHSATTFAERLPRLVFTGRLCIDISLTGDATIGGRRLSLTMMQLKTLKVLAKHKGAVVLRDTLIKEVYAGAKQPESRTLEVFISELRRKIRAAGGDDCIASIHGRGYMLYDIPSEEC